MLFPDLIDPSKNLLPIDGIVNYYGKIIEEQEAQDYFHKLLDEIPWEQDQVHLYGKTIVTKRKVAWFGNQPYSYTYSNTTRTALLWTPILRELKALVEQKSEETYNSCLMNLYHDGDEGMSWHSDNEKELKKEGAIATFSLGAERKFSLKHRTADQKVSVSLENGSLLIMKGATQQYWLHAITKTKKVKAPRISLTFRTIEGS